MLLWGNHTSLLSNHETLSPGQIWREGGKCNWITQKVPCSPCFLHIFKNVNPTQEELLLWNGFKTSPPSTFPSLRSRGLWSSRKERMWPIERRLLQRKGSPWASDHKKGKLFYLMLTSAMGKTEELIDWFWTCVCLFGLIFFFSFLGDWPFKFF